MQDSTLLLLNRRNSNHHHHHSVETFDMETSEFDNISATNDTGAGAAPEDQGASLPPRTSHASLGMRGRSSSRTKSMDLNLYKSVMPGSSQFYPAGALGVAVVTLLITIIVNRSTYDQAKCPKGPDWFVLATGSNVSNSWCVRKGFCKKELDGGLLPTVMSNGMNASEYLATHEFDCSSDIGGIDYPLFSDAGADSPQFWIFAPGLTITAMFIWFLSGENFMRHQIAGITRRQIKQRKTGSESILNVLKIVALVCGIVGGVCLIGLAWCDVNTCSSHINFSYTFFLAMVLFQVANTVNARIQLKWALSKENRKRQKQMRESKNAATVNNAREKILRLRRKSLLYKYAVSACTFLFFSVSYFIGIPLTNNVGGREGVYCGTYYQPDVGPGKDYQPGVATRKDFTIDCCGQKSPYCYSIMMMRSTNQTLTILSLLLYLLTFWNDFRIDPSAEVEAAVVKASKRLSMILRQPRKSLVALIGTGHSDKVGAPDAEVGLVQEQQA